MSQPGIGVMIGLIDGNEETINAIKESLNKIIKSVVLNDENQLVFIFDDKSILRIYDDGQSCCEYRHMSTDDDLDYYSSSKLLDLELTSEETKEIGEYGEVHDVQFLKIKTSKGVFTMVNHNEHNGYYGYYGGFWIVAELQKLNKEDEQKEVKK